MADRIVTSAHRDIDGDIIAIGSDQESWSQRQRQWVINDIVTQRHRYFVIGTMGEQVPIDVVSGESGPYIRARADDVTFNNLDNLEDLNYQPWEIVVEDAEILAIHCALVPHGAEGQIVLLGGDEHDSSNADSDDVEDVHNTRIYDVHTNEIIFINSPIADVFCCGHAFLPDGRLFVGGGTEFWRHDNPEHMDMHATPRNHWSGARECSIYDLDGDWTPAANMLPQPGQETGGGRWYPTLITLSDGRILAVGGHPSLSDGRHGSWAPEVYDLNTDSWSYVGGHWIYVDWADVPVERIPTDGPLFDEDNNPTTGPLLDDEGNLIELLEFPSGQTRPSTNPDSSFNYMYYPRLFVVPGGTIFMVSPNNNLCGWYDPLTGLIDPVSVVRPPHGSGYSETNHTAVMLPLLPGDNYTPHILFLGMDGPHRITLAGFTVEEPPVWEPAASRDWANDPPLRRHGCATLLPTGDVIFTGGINSTDGAGLPDENAVLSAEIYTPGVNWETNVIDFELEEWNTTPQANVPRNYHSVALLLPNGRILTAGSNLNGTSGNDDVKEYRIEIYTPFYYHEAQRPQIVSAPGSLTYEEEFDIQIINVNDIQRVALMRCGSVTHAWDGDQRYIGLNFTSSDGNLSVTAPPDGSVAPPGPYMLWVIDSENLPCQLAPFVILS